MKKDFNRNEGNPLADGASLLQEDKTREMKTTQRRRDKDVRPL